MVAHGGHVQGSTGHGRERVHEEIPDRHDASGVADVSSVEHHVHLSAHHLVPHRLHHRHRGAPILVPGVGVVRGPASHVAVQDGRGGARRRVGAGQRGHLEDVLVTEVVREHVSESVVDAGVGESRHASQSRRVDEALLPPACGVGGGALHLLEGELGGVGGDGGGD